MATVRTVHNNLAFAPQWQTGGTAGNSRPFFVASVVGSKVAIERGPVVIFTVLGDTKLAGVIVPRLIIVG